MLLSVLASTWETNAVNHAIYRFFDFLFLAGGRVQERWALTIAIDTVARAKGSLTMFAKLNPPEP